ncbi:MAG: PAS domain S-box protein [Arcobacteraceae bacterium]
MSYNLKLFFTFVVFGICLALFTVAAFVKITDEQKVLNKIKMSHQVLIAKETQISEFITELDTHLHSIKNNVSFQKFVQDGSDKKYVEGLLETLTQSENYILQAKYIDNFNNEIINLNYSKNPESKEQSKNLNSYSFKEIKKQNIGEIWNSKMGINLTKNTKIEIDEPFFIIGMNLKNGVLVFHISLKKIEEILEDRRCRFILVDKNGNIIIDSEKKLSWSLPLGKDVDFLSLIGEKNKEFLQEDYKTTDKYLLMKLTVKNSDEAKLIVIYPRFESIIKKDMYYLYLMILISAILLAVVLAYIFSRPMIKLTQKIEKLNKRLDKKVEQRTADLNDSLKIIDKYVIRSVTDTFGKIISVSEAFCEVSQYSKKELIGKPHSIVRHPDMDSTVFKEMWKTIKSGKRWNGKVKNLAKDGTFYWVEAHVEPNFEDGKIVSYTAIRNDITDKVLLEELNDSLNEKIREEVEKNTKQLEIIQQEQIKSTKLSSIGALAAGITHEINTPLTYIKGNFELIKYDLEELPQSEIRDRILEDSEVITDGINRISNIVEAMREVSQSSCEVREKVDIFDTLRTALIISNNNAKQVTKIYINGKIYSSDFDMKDSESTVLIQKQRIEQVWIIIINNALDELVKKDEYESRRLDIDVFKEDDKVIVEFKDNAGGIPQELLETIFDPFVSTKQSGGIGIGLNVARKIIEENQGTIIAKNTQDGANFRIELSSEGKNDRTK